MQCTYMPHEIRNFRGVSKEDKSLSKLFIFLLEFAVKLQTRQVSMDVYMIWIDYVIISIIVFSSLVSLIRGFLRETLSLVAWICAFFVARDYYSYLAIYLSSFKEQVVRNGIAIALLFVVTLIVGVIANYVIISFLEKSNLSGIDRMFGFCFGMLRGVLIVSGALFFIDTFTGFSHSQDWQQSQLIPQFSGISKWFFDYLQSTSSFLLRKRGEVSW